MQERTKRQYLEIADKLIHRYERETGEQWVDSPLGLCRWMSNMAHQWSCATWRLRKSAMIYFMQNHGPSETIDYLKSAKWSPAKEKRDTPNTSQKKARRLTIEELGFLLDNLQTSTGKHDTFIAKWILSGLLVGIRPCEWYGAKIDGQSLVLRNAKFNKDRSCGEFRSILFQPDKIEYLRTVVEFVEELNGMDLSEIEFRKLYEACRRRLYDVNKRIWPDKEKFICFYTTRHQFSANAKKSLDLVSVAALMGHRSTDTATRNYLKSRHGDEDMIFVAPNPENMGLVEDKFQKHDFGHKKNEETTKA